MATSSISKNFTISGNRQAERFLTALEQSALSCPHGTTNAVPLRGSADLKKLLLLRKQNGR